MVTTIGTCFPTYIGAMAINRYHLNGSPFHSMLPIALNASGPIVSTRCHFFFFFFYYLNDPLHHSFHPFFSSSHLEISQKTGEFVILSQRHLQCCDLYCLNQAFITILYYNLLSSTCTIAEHNHVCSLSGQLFSQPVNSKVRHCHDAFWPKGGRWNQLGDNVSY